MTHRQTQRGFTLIELMIVVLVLGILTAIAYPSYTSHLRKSRRAEAQQVLMDAYTRQQQQLLDTRSYIVSATKKVEDTGAPINTTLASFYTFAMDPSTASTFTLTATPAGSQVGDSCAMLSITHLGQKSPATCW